MDERQNVTSDQGGQENTVTPIEATDISQAQGDTAAPLINEDTDGPQKDEQKGEPQAQGQEGVPQLDAAAEPQTYGVEGAPQPEGSASRGASQPQRDEQADDLQAQGQEGVPQVEESSPAGTPNPVVQTDAPQPVAKTISSLADAQPLDARTNLPGGQASPQAATSPRWITKPRLIVALVVAAIAVIAGASFLASSILNRMRPVRGSNVAQQMTDRYEDDTRVAAQLDGTTITEGQATARVMTFRVSNGLEDEDAWSGWLSTQGMTPETVRTYVLERIVAENIVRAEAEKMEVEITDDQLSEQIAKNRKNYVKGWEGASDKDLEKRWAKAIEPTQLDGLAYEDRTRELMLEAEIARVVSRQGMTYEQWYKAQLAARQITYAEMPDDLPYAV